jgi:uracil-DNA glycosylase
MPEHSFSSIPGIIELLEAQLICPQAHSLHQSYTQIADYHLPGNQKIDASRFCFLNGSLQNYLAQFSSKCSMAIDLPVLLHRGTVRPRIMICAMDALPPIPESIFWKDKSFNQREDVGLGVPFSLVDDWSIPRGSLFSNLAFFKEMLEEYDLYITDIYKLFFRIKMGGAYINSNALKEYTSLLNNEGLNFHASLLAKEIEIVRPELIITLGNASRNAMGFLIQHFQNRTIALQPWSDKVQQYQWNDRIPWIASPHISNAANSTKKLLLHNPAYSFIDGNYANQRLARILLHEIQQHN